MSTNWHYREGDRELGPITFAELRALACSGSLAETDFVRRDGDDEWQKAYRVIGLFAETPRRADPAQSAPRVNTASPAAKQKTAASQAAMALQTGSAGPHQPSGELQPPPVTNRPPAGTPTAVPWWKMPLDWVEIALLCVVAALLIGGGVYLWWDSRPERFPKPKGTAPTATYAGKDGGRK